MTIQENVPLAPYTTFHIGGPARYFTEAHTEDDIHKLISFARARRLPLFVLGGGSNLLVPDEGVEAVVIRMMLSGIDISHSDESIQITAGAGVPWNALVDAAAAQGVFGIENLAGVPGTIGGAVVQNIGAYGAALSDTFTYADAIDLHTGERHRLTRDECKFGYRDSLFKHDRTLLIVSATFSFPTAKDTAVNLSYRDPDKRYKDLEHLLDDNQRASPAEIAEAIRKIRSEKFPDLSKEGTAGSFFSNPILSRAEATELQKRFPGLPLFPLPETTGVKIPIGWILDNVLHLRGYERGAARVYERHALVIATRIGATASDVEELARDITEKVRSATGILLEREVETFGTVTTQ